MDDGKHLARFQGYKTSMLNFRVHEICSVYNFLYQAFKLRLKRAEHKINPN